MIRQFVAVLTAAVVAVAAGSAFAGGGVGGMAGGGATEITQILNNTELIGQTMQQIELVTQGIQQVNQMIRDAQRLASDPLGLGQIIGVYNQVMGEVRQVQSLAYGTVNAVSNFQALNPQFILGRAFDLKSFIARNNSTMSTIQGIIGANASALARADSDQARIAQLGQMVNTADGTTQALQTANAIQYEVLNQLRETKAYNQTVAQAEAAFMGARVTDDNDKKAATSNAAQSLSGRRLVD